MSTSATSPSDTSRRPRLALFASGRGSNVEKLLDVLLEGDLPAEVGFVFSNKTHAPVLERARARGVEARALPRRGRAREEHEREILELLERERIDHLCLCGYLRVLSPAFLERFPGHVLNIHPSLLPDFPGLGAQARQWDAGVAVAGATVHVVDAGVDTGPAILQGSIEVRGDEGPEGLADRILTEVEHVIYPRALEVFLRRLHAGEPIAPGVPARPVLSDWVTSPTPATGADAGRDPTPSPPKEDDVIIGRVRRALLSVSDKTDLVELAKGLVEREVELLASGGTAAAIADAGLPVTPVEAWTGAPEVLGGRVKTLHPRIHAGLLADRRDDAHLAELEANGYGQIDLVVCNLYPFRETVASGADVAGCVEKIDVGGPTMLRAAAKNHAGGVTVVTDPADYPRVLELLRDEGKIPDADRASFAARAFRMTADYDAAIAGWTAEHFLEDAAPTSLFEAGFARRTPLRYGENPHQEASLVVEGGEPRGVAHGTLLQGKALSYNNYLDMDGAYRSVAGLEGLACSVVKHTNPCGLAIADTQAAAFEAALSGDPVSAFGSILGFNAPLEGDAARAIKESKLFVECIVAPGFTEEAREVFRKRKNLRLFEVPAGPAVPREHLHRIGGGLLVQDVDPGVGATDDWRVVTERSLDEGWMDELRFAMHCVAQLKSNAIALTRGRALRGAGAGHMSRVDACALALEKAGEEARGAFLASDAFFPFDDCVRMAAERGVVAVVQPGGSKRDDEVIAACDALGLAMVFTGRRHFRH